MLYADINAAAHAVTKTPKRHHVSPVHKSLHWLKINQRIQYKIISLTHKTLHSGHPSYLRSLLHVSSTLGQLVYLLLSHLVVLLISLVSNSLVDRSIYHTAPSHGT